MREYGYKYVDYNGNRQIGVSFVHATIKGGMRDSAYRAFLQPLANNTAKLKLSMESLVTKILIGPSRKAYGVVYFKNGKKIVALANKEVIICAGAINTPQLLMLSGIGPRQHLKEMGIHVLKDLPVGMGLRDHIGFLGMTYTVNESITFTSDQLLSKESLMILKKFGSGPLTTVDVEALGMIDTGSWARTRDKSKPNVEYAFFGRTLNADRGSSIKGLYRISDYYYERFWKKIENKSAFTIVPILYRSSSTGNVKLRSADPSEYPLLYGNFYKDPRRRDVKAMITAIRLIQKIVTMPALRRYDATLLSPVPGCESSKPDSDQYWECALRHFPMTFYDPHGTCKMGRTNDSEAVVDPELKVHGIRKLRIVDASVFPDAISGHINGVCYAVAEKIADLIIRGNIKQVWTSTTTTKTNSTRQSKRRKLGRIEDEISDVVN